MVDIKDKSLDDLLRQAHLAYAADDLIYQRYDDEIVRRLFELKNERDEAVRLGFKHATEKLDAQRALAAAEVELSELKKELNKIKLTTLKIGPPMGGMF